MPKPIFLRDAEKVKVLVAKCQAGARDGWNELFEWCLQDIKKIIVYTLLRYGREDLKNDDTIAEIVVSVYTGTRNGIHGLKDPNGLKAWIATISRNKTLDFLNSLNTRQRKHKRHIENNTVTLDSSITADGTITIGDQVPAPVTNFSFSRVLEESLSEINNLSELHQWAFRLKAIFYNPFGTEEIESLSAYLNRPLETVRRQINALMDLLVEKSDQKESLLSEAALLQYEIETLRRRLFVLKDGAAASAETAHLKDVVVAKKRLLNQKEKQGQQVIAPSNSQVATILGIPPEKANSIGVIVHRIRQRLKQGQGYQALVMNLKEDAESNQALR